MEWINLSLVTSGIISSLVFAGVLLASRINRKANPYLAFLVLALGINLLLSFSLSQHLFDQYPLLHLLPFGISFGLGPLLYLYTKTLTGQPASNYHLLWLLLDYPHSLFHLIYGRTGQLELIHDVLDKMGVASMLLIGYYVFRSWKVIGAYRAEIRNKLSNLERQTLSWITQLILIFLISLVVSGALWFVLFQSGLNFNSRILGHFYFTASIFWLGIGGIRQPEIKAAQLSGRSEDEPETGSNEEHVTLLVQSMEEERLFLMSDLNVRYLEDQLGLTAKQISEALNVGLGKNFYTFINEYRVDEFKKQIKDNPHLTLAGVALECGFNSKTTFQRVFKEMTGMRPTEYLQSLK